MRIVILLCAAFAGCTYVPPLCRPYEARCAVPYDGGPPGDSQASCPATPEECARVWGCPEACRYDAAVPETDGGVELDAGQDAGLETDAGATCNPGSHTAVCMNPASCIGADHVCRPCC